MNKEWDFVPKGTEISMVKFVIEYFTPITLGRQQQDASSDEDTEGIWEAAKEEAISDQSERSESKEGRRREQQNLS